MKNAIYMQVTTDEYELPVAVASSIGELAEITGFTYSQIATRISWFKSGKVKKRQFVKVEVSDE